MLRQWTLIQVNKTGLKFIAYYTLTYQKTQEKINKSYAIQNDITIKKKKKTRYIYMSCVIYRVTWRGTRLALKKIRVFFNRWMGCLPKFLSLDPSWRCVVQFFQNSEKSVRGVQILKSCS